MLKTKKNSVFIRGIRVKVNSENISIKVNNKESLRGPLHKILINISKIIEVIILKLIKKIPQPKNQKGKIVKFKRLKPHNSLINSEMKFQQLYNKIRMLDHVEYPRAHIKIGKLKFYLKNVKKFRGKLICDVTIVKNSN